MPRPRIRSLKPEHPLHPKIGPLSDRAYRIWITMICYADDEGRREYRPEELRALIYAYQPKITDKDLTPHLEELQASGLIHVYSLNGRSLYQLHDWKDHQKVQHPVPSQLPPPTNAVLMSPHEDSGGLTKPLSDRDRDRDRDRDQIRSSRQEPHENSGGLMSTPENNGNSARDILAWLNAKAGKNFPPTKSNLDFIRGRIREGFLPEQLKAIVSRKVREASEGKFDRTYLRPATLFNATKFSQYVGELPKVETDGNHAV